MKKILLFFAFVVFALSIQAQTEYDTVAVYDPQAFTEMTTIDPANGQIISRKNSLNRRVNFDTLRNYVTPSVTHAWLSDPLDSTDVLSSYWRQFVTDSLGRVWYVDADGDAKMLLDPTGGSVGSGSSGYLTYWNSGTTITNTDVAYTSTLIDADALTGAFGFPLGTTAQRPLVSTGRMRFNSDLGDMEFYNGSAWRSLAESSANAFTAGQFIIANPAGILSDTTAAGALSMMGGTSGSGASPQVAYWSGASTLTGHANLLWDGTELSVGTTNSAYTLDMGSGGLRIGGQSAAPTGAAGVVYYDTDDNWYLGHNGTSFIYFAKSLAASFGNTRIPFANSNGILTDDPGFTYSFATDVLSVPEDVVAEVFKTEGGLANEGLWLGSSATISILATGTGGNSNKFNFNLHSGGNEGWCTFQESGGTDVASIGAVDGVNRGVFTNHYSGLTIGSAVTYTSRQGTSANAGTVTYSAGTGNETFNAGNIVLQGGGFAASTTPTGVTGIIEIKTAKDVDSVSTAATLRTHMRFSGRGARTTTQLLNRLATTTGTQVLTMESDTIKYRIENFGAISTTTDASGDVTVTHGMGTTPTAVLVTPTGTTAWGVSVHTIGGTTFKVRFYDLTTGLAVAVSTAVTATWLGKT